MLSTLLVPNRMRLFFARAVAPVVIALVVALVAALTVLAIGVAQAVGPSVLNSALGVALMATPGVAIMQSLSTAVTVGAVPEALKGLGVLIAWILVVGTAARARFAHEGLEA